MRSKISVFRASLNHNVSCVPKSCTSRNTVFRGFEGEQGTNPHSVFQMTSIVQFHHHNNSRSKYIVFKQRLIHRIKYHPPGPNIFPIIYLFYYMNAILPLLAYSLYAFSLLTSRMFSWSECSSCRICIFLHLVVISKIGFDPFDFCFSAKFVLVLLSWVSRISLSNQLYFSLESVVFLSCVSRISLLSQLYFSHVGDTCFSVVEAQT